MGHRTQDPAQKYHISQGRISQMRRYFQKDWARFCGDAGGEHPLEV